MQLTARSLAILLLLAACFLPTRAHAQTPAASPSFPNASLQTDARAIAAFGLNRSAGTPAADKTADYLEQRLKSATRLPVWRQRFTVTVPQVNFAEAFIPPAQGADTANPHLQKYPVFPFTPVGGQPPALPQNQATAEVVYVGQGQLPDLAGKVIKDRWVAMDLQHANWTTIASLGPRGILFLGKPDLGAQDFIDKWTPVPVGIPRFYLDDPALITAIKTGTAKSLTLRVNVAWTEKPADNLLCLIPGRQTTPNLPGTQGKSGWTDQLIILQAKYDAASEVLGNAPGAEQSVNAAALVEIAGQLAHAPDRCSVLIVLTEGDEWLFRGTRHLLTMLRRENKDPKRAIIDLQSLLTDSTTAAAEAQQVCEGLQRLAASQDLAALEAPSVRAAVKDQIDRQAARVEEDLQRNRLADATPENKAQRLALEDHKTALLTASTAVSRQTKLSESQPLIIQAAAETLPGWTTERQRRDRDRDAKHQWLDLRQAIGERNPMLHIELQLTSGSDRFGFFARSSYTLQNDLAGRMTDFGRAFRQYLKDAHASNPQSFDSAFDPNSMESTYTLESFFPVHRAFSTDASLTRGLPAAAFATEYDAAARLGTPNDTLEQLNWTNLNRQLTDVCWLLLGSPQRNTPGILTDPAYYARAELPNNTNDAQLTLYEQTLGDTKLHLGAAQHLIGFEQEKSGYNWIPNLAGTRRTDWEITRVDGAAAFLGHSKNNLKIQAFRFRPDGTPDRSLSQLQATQSSVVASFTPAPNDPHACMVFDCQRLDLFNLYDPRYMDNLDKIQLLDAKRMDNVQYTANYIRDGIGAIFMPPATTWQLLVAKGDIANRMVIVNADKQHPMGRGFTSVNLADIGPLSWQNANDLYWLDTFRKENLERFGISNELIQELHASSKKYLDAGRDAQSHLDYAQWLGNADAAWSLQSQVYNNLIATSNGIIHGVIFLLLGIIPFSYFLERLIIGATNVYKQITGFAVIFILMTAALWFHPAFRISSAPAMILLAFLILILSTTVVYILFGKFEEEIARIRGAGAGSHSANLKRGAVLGAAVRLGLSNMRRRGTRTTLTLITLVLLTFTLLCFTSVRESLHLTPRLVTDAPTPPPAGILLRQRGWKALPIQIQTTVRDLSGPRGLSAERWWLSSESPDTPWAIPITPTARPSDSSDSRKTFFANGLVGLDPAEQRFQTADLAQILPHWSQFAAGQPVCFLPDSQRELLHLVPGDTVEILGLPLTVAGFFDPVQAAEIKQINGDSLMPIDPAASGAAPGTTSSTSPEDIAAMTETNNRFLNPSQIAIVPAAIARQLNARLTSVMVLPENTADIIPRAEELARRSAFTVFASDGKQVLSYNAAASTRPENLDKVLVPMVIAAVIVLNTMLGAVSERTREIHVYTSLGLAPAHVGTLFLAEAAALGTLGVVFGYIFGQGLATILGHFRLMAGVDLNYSSMSAIITMGLVAGLVMLSALWPARTASRVAAPSLQRDWKLPPAVGDLLKVDLPFTVNHVAASGVCAFLEEFFTTVSQAGSGRFTADHIHTFQNNGIRGIQCRIWLAPYDLGVIQTFWMAVHPTPEPNVFEVRLTLVREAGSPSSWHRLNRPFLVEVRKQFLLWRAVKPELVKAYVQKSQAMFAQAQPLTPPVAA